MGKIKAGALIDLFERMAREGWRYEWGAAREGCVDCSGAFVYAYKQFGASIEHGSNSICRKRVGTLRPIGEAKPGWACFKVRGWRDGERSHRWHGTEPGDCYHIGLMGRRGLILNAKSSAEGFVSSSPSDGWSVCAPLSAVDYDEMGGEVVADFGNASVSISSGHLNLRAGASTSAKVIAKLDKYERVNVVRDTGAGWLYVKTEIGEAGYVAAEYIAHDPETGDEGEQTDEDAQETASGEGETRKVTCIVRDDGVMIWLAGSWRVAED